MVRCNDGLLAVSRVYLKTRLELRGFSKLDTEPQTAPRRVGFPSDVGECECVNVLYIVKHLREKLNANAYPYIFKRFSRLDTYITV